MNWKHVFLSLCFVGCGVLPTLAVDVVLVEDSQPRAQIVISEKPTRGA